MPAPRRVFGAAAALIGFIFLILLPPWRVAMPSNTLDPSWMMTLPYAFAHGWQFGRDIIFTYGPLGFITSTLYHPDYYGISLTFWLVFYGTLALALCMLYRGAGAAALGLLILVGVTLTYNWAHDGPWFVACLCVFLLARRGERASSIVAGALVLLLAVTVLIKSTSLILALPAMVLVDAARAVRFKSIPLFTPLLLGAFLVLYLAAGQDLESLGAYLATALEISRGYGDAMQSYGSLGELAIFGAITALLFCTIVWAELSRRAWLEGLIAACMVAGLIFVAAKAGFVRHDTGHAMIAWVALTLTAAAYFGDMAAQRMPRFLVATAAIAGVIMCGATYVKAGRELNRPQAAPALLAGDLTDQIRDDINGSGRVLFGDQVAQFDAAYDDALARIRSEATLPAVTGTVDIFGVDQAVVLAYGLDYKPRPVFQGYSVYTPNLLEKNRAALLGPRAPETILFDLQSVDNRFPALDEGALWPDLLRRYDVTAFEGGYAVLKRRNTSRTIEFHDLQQASMTFGQTLDVSSWANDLLWVEMDFAPTLLGRLRSFLFKPPMVMLTITTNYGNVLTFRLIPGVTGQGFLLSPLVESPAQFAQLSERDETVTAFSVTAVGQPFGTFDNEIAVRLKRLSIAGENETPAALDLAALSKLRTMRALSASAGAVAGQKRPELRPGNKLLAHAPSKLSLAVPPGATELLVSYGVLEGAWGPGYGTDGACFRVSADGAAIHDACLDPTNIEGDRQTKYATVPLPSGAVRLTFETSTGPTEAWDWTYWSAVDFR